MTTTARSRAVAAILLIIAMAVAACSGSPGSGDEEKRVADDATGVVHGELPADGPAEPGGILTTVDPSDTPTLDPHKSSAAYAQLSISGIVYSKLLEYDSGRDIAYGTVQVKPDLAASYEHSADGRQWTFELRRGVKWQNIAPVSGREFTSADVACTFDRIAALPGFQTASISMIRTVTTPDPYTVVFGLDRPFASFDLILASSYMEIIPCEGARGEFDLAERAIGTGPFILQKWDRNVQRTYVKNPSYYQEGKPYLDGINVVIMGDPNATLAAFRTGQVDVAGVTDQLYESLLSSNGDAVVRSQLGMAVHVIFMNQGAKPFDDLRVRKAVLLAWDRKGMGDAYFSGYALTGAYPAALDGAISSEESDALFPYDPDAARKLLAEAGYPDGFSVDLLTTDGYGPNFVNHAQWIQQDLKDVGITVNLQIRDYATYFASYQQKEFAIGYGYVSGGMSADEWLRATYQTGGARNWFNLSDPALDQMITEQQGMLDPQARTRKLHEIGEYIEDNVVNPAMGLQGAGLSAQQPYVHNLYAVQAYSRSYLAEVWLDSAAPGRR